MKFLRWTLVVLLSFFCFCQVTYSLDKEKTQKEKEQELVDFSSIKDLLKQDMLEAMLKNNRSKSKQLRRKEQILIKVSIRYPQKRIFGL